MDSSDITTVYQAIPTRTNTAPLTYTLIPFPEAVRIIQIKNGTSSNLLLSSNGIDDHETIFANQGIVLDYCANKSTMGGLLELPGNGFLWVRYDPTPPYYQLAPNASEYIAVTVIFAATD